MHTTESTAGTKPWHYPRSGTHWRIQPIVLHERKSTLAEVRARAQSQALMSSDDDAMPGWTGRTGAELRAAREALGWKLADVSASLRIRLPYLEAIEEGRNDALPGIAYAVGFVRAYAKVLGLDAVATARRFRAESGEAGRLPVLDFPAPVPEGGVPAGALALLGVILVAIVYTGWYYVSGERPNPQIVQQVPDRLAPLAQTAMSTPIAGQVPVVTPPPAVAQAPQPTPLAPAPVVPGPSAAAPAVPPSAPAAAATPDAAGIVLHAHADTWVQVRDPAISKVIYNHVLHPGESWPVPATPGLLLTVGNAGGLDITVDGKEAPAIGAIGGVRRDIPLDPQLIRDGKLPPPPKPKPKPKAPDVPADGGVTADGSAG